MNSRPRPSPLPLALALATLVLAAPLAASTEPDAPIGRVKTAAGAAFLVSGGERKAAEVGDPVLQNDSLETGADGSLGVVFRDESRVSLGPDTQLVVDRYVFAPEEAEASFLARMARGTLLFVSGLISKASPDATEVRTPAGILGVRGTRFLVRLSEPAD